MTRDIHWRAIVTASLAAAALACGSEEAPTPSGEPLATPTPATRRGDNRPPFVEQVRFTSSHPVARVPLQVDVTASDPDGDPIRLRYTWRHNGELLAATGASATLASTRKGDRIEVEVIATDGVLESAPARAAVRVRNRPPVLHGVRIQPEGAVEPGSVLYAVAAAEDADDDPIQFRYQWLVNRSEDPAVDRSFSVEGLKRGDVIKVRVIATDGEDESNPLESPEVEVQNAAPEILSTAPSLGSDGRFRYRLRARDPDADRNLRYRLASGPKGMQIDPMLGEVTWRPDPEQVGRHAVEVEVVDPHGAVTAQQFYLTVNVEPETPAALME